MIHEQKLEVILASSSLLSRSISEIIPLGIGHSINRFLSQDWGFVAVRLFFTAIVTAAFLLGQPGPTVAEEGDPIFFTLAAGYYDINDNMDAVEFRAEVRARDKIWIFKPLGGVMVSSDGALYGFGGVLVDFYLGRRFVFTPSFAAGLYEDGDGKDLGHAVEFRSSVELAYRFNDRSRLGMSFYHLSNAGLSDNNPGTEVLSLNYSIPFN